MAFWRRKKDEFVSLGLSGPAGESSPVTQTENEPQAESAKVAAPEPKKFWFAPEAGHEDLARFGALEAVVTFLDRHIG